MGKILKFPAEAKSRQEQTTSDESEKKGVKLVRLNPWVGLAQEDAFDIRHPWGGYAWYDLLP